MEITERLAHLFAPIMESFDLLFNYPEAWITKETRHIFGGGAPMLSLVRIIEVEPIACLPPLSFVKFLRFEGGFDSIEEVKFLGILRSSPALVSLNLDGIVVEPYGLHQLALQGENVEIPSLRSLSCSADGSPKYWIDSILNIIHCPALESLAISGLEDAFDEWDDLEALPVPPFPALRSITLTEIECTEFVNYFDFTHLPALDTISLLSCTSPMALLQLLLPSQGKVNSDIVWPALRVIKLSHLDAEGFDGLCEVISHRQACGKPIKAVAFDPTSLRRFPEKVEWMKQHVTVHRGSLWPILLR